MQNVADIAFGFLSYVAENYAIFVVVINAIAALLIWQQIRAHNVKAGFEAAVTSFELSDRIYERWLDASRSNEELKTFCEGQVAALLELEAFQINNKKLSSDLADFYGSSLVGKVRIFVLNSEYFRNIDFQSESEDVFHELRRFITREAHSHRDLDAVKSALGI